jgi:hypothetical protein
MKGTINYAKQLINGFLQRELVLFKNQFNESPVPEIQDSRSLSIAWVCFYFKELITTETAKQISDYVDEIYQIENYTTHGWYRISSLQASAFILTGNKHYANSLLQHLDCGQSWARGFIIESAAIICPLLKFQNTFLQKSTESNLKYIHGMDEECTILYLCTVGTLEEKQNWLSQQIEINTKEFHQRFFEILQTSGKLYKSEFFIRAFDKAKSYFLFKTICEPTFIEVQPQLFDDTAVRFEQLLKTEKEHPLSDVYIDLSFLKTEQESKI